MGIVGALGQPAYEESVVVAPAAQVGFDVGAAVSRGAGLPRRVVVDRDRVARIPESENGPAGGSCAG